MLQLATLSARGASEVPDLLITPGGRAAPARASTLHRSCFGPAWRSPLQFAISTIGNSAGLISAGYMIVNELAPTPSGLWSERPSRQPCGADPSSSRSPTVREGLSPRRDCAEKESTVTPRPLRSARSLAARSSRSQRDKNSWLFDPRHRQAKDVPRRPIFHKSKDLPFAHRWTDPNGGQMVSDL